MKRLALAPLLLGAACSHATPLSVPPPTTAAALPPASATPEESSRGPITVGPPAIGAKPSERASTSVNDFTLRAYGAFRGSSENYVFSGASLADALHMAAMGARGTTKEELLRVLGPLPEFADRFSETHDFGKTLHIANRLWADDHARLRSSYAQSIANFGAGADRLAIQAHPEEARATINRWVESATGGSVSELLPKGSLSNLTELVLTNAVHFKAGWASEFSPSLTKPGPFTMESGSTTPASFMHREGSLPAADLPEIGAKVAELPYRDSDFGMLLLVPNDARGIAKLESAIGSDTLPSYTSKLAPRRVDLTLPKFHFKAGGNVSAKLQALGIRTAFSPGHADFGDMLDEGAKALKIDAVFHEASIAVDEHGTEASAATATVMGVRGLALGAPLEVRADRPFVFAIRNRKNGRILFFGRVGRPVS